MKVILKALALSLALTTTNLYAGSYEDNNTITPDHNYEIDSIDSWGRDPDVYEFTPRSNHNKRCVVFVLNGSTMECFDAPKEDKK